LDNEPLHYNFEDGARLDVVARDFWGRNRQHAFLTLGCLTHLQAAICYITNELEKRHAYDERVREVERACFSPLVFSASVAWVLLLPRSIRSWHRCWQRNGTLTIVVVYFG